MNEGAFSKTPTRWFVGICAVSFLGALLLSVFGPDMERVASYQADTYSNSAVGHSAFVQLLHAIDIPVITSRHNSSAKAAEAGLLVIAEPHDCAISTPRGDALKEMVESARTVLLVLSKWEAKRDPSKAGWVKKLWLRPAGEVEQALEALGIQARVQREPVLRSGQPVGVQPWEDLSPRFPTPIAQVITGSGLQPLLVSAGGMLLAETHVEGTRVVILTDPDLLSNGGLGHGDNAALTVAALERVRPAGGVVVIDETIHGYEREPSIWRELFSFPLVLLLLQAAVIVVLVLWAGMGRFGAAERAAPVIEPGRRSLITNTVELLRYRGAKGEVLTKYLRRAVLDARRGLRAPRSLTGSELQAWLELMGERRGTHDSLAALRADVTSGKSAAAGVTAVLRTAQRIHRWRREILHGSSSRT